MNEDFVEIIQIWMPVEKGGEAYSFQQKQNLKLIAMIANGQPLQLEDGFLMERVYRTKRELQEITKQRGEL